MESLDVAKFLHQMSYEIAESVLVGILDEASEDWILITDDQLDFMHQAIVDGFVRGIEIAHAAQIVNPILEGVPFTLDDIKRGVTYLSSPEYDEYLLRLSKPKRNRKKE